MLYLYITVFHVNLPYQLCVDEPYPMNDKSAANCRKCKTDFKKSIKEEITYHEQFYLFLNYALQKQSAEKLRVVCNREIVIK